MDHLKEFKLINTAITDSGLMSTLLSDMKLRGCKLRSLSLVKVGLEQRAAETIAEMLEERPPHLQELDISWNQIPPK